VPYPTHPHHRRSIRVKGYDYSHAGAYFVTLCTEGKRFLFGEIVADQMRTNGYGRVAHEEWWRAEKIRPGLRLDAWVVMPNHVHGIVFLPDPQRRGAQPCAPTELAKPARLHRPPRSLASLVAQYKASSARKINALRGTPGAAVWQRGYYEHIVRNDADLERIREYISANPLRWPFDRENPAREENREEDLWFS
jgi:putative transposase